MPHRPSGLRLVPRLLRWSRPVSCRAGLLALVVIALVAALAPTASARTGTTEGISVLDPVEASVSTPLAHGGDDAGGSTGVPTQSDARIAEAAGQQDAGTGDLTVSDREVLYKVKQAGLWEMPVGMWLSERAVDPKVRDAGTKISTEHQELDGLVNEAAAQLGVPLPTEPSPEQQGWMREIDAQSGAAFDERGVFLLRQAHGIVLPVLAQVRVATRNPVIRQLTTDAMAFVQRHIEYLESTGLVDYEQLPGVSEANNPKWGSNALTYVLFALVTALFAVLIVLAGRTLAGAVRKLAGSRTSRTTTPRAAVRGHHARS
jgi:predicted outer membrane protein